MDKNGIVVDAKIPSLGKLLGQNPRGCPSPPILSWGKLFLCAVITHTCYLEEW